MWQDYSHNRFWDSVDYKVKNKTLINSNILIGVFICYITACAWNLVSIGLYIKFTKSKDFDIIREFEDM